MTDAVLSCCILYVLQNNALNWRFVIVTC